MRSIKQRLLSYIAITSLCVTSQACFAVAFSVVPKTGTSLPSTVYAGASNLALYTVTNISLRTLSNAFIKYLPPNVTQVTSDSTYPDLCGATFTLASRSSCTLELSVSGAVSASDPDAHHHLFICTPNLPACAGTNYPLDVSLINVSSIAISPLNQLLAEGGSLQYTATGTYADGSTHTVNSGVTWSSTNTSIATIGSSSGLATGVAPGTTTISAAFNGATASTTLTIKPQYAYVTNSNGRNTVTVCEVGSSLNNCIETIAVFNDPRGIALNASYTVAYIANHGQNTISICPVTPPNLNVLAANCSAASGSTAGGLLNQPQGVLLNAAATKIYITNNGSNAVTTCSLSGDGLSISGCTNNTGTFANPVSAVFNQDESLMYVVNVTGSTISRCSMDSNGDIVSCNAAINPGNVLHAPSVMIFNPSFTNAYISNNNNTTISSFNTIAVCKMKADGTFDTGQCYSVVDSSNGFSFIEGIGMDAAGSLLYVANYAGGVGTTLSVCPLPALGVTSMACLTDTGGGNFSAPFAAYIH